MSGARTDMNILYLSGSPRRDSNTDRLLEIIRSVAPGEMLKLVDHTVEHCRCCWSCRERDCCVIDDDFTRVIWPKMAACDALVIGCPVYFNNVPSQTKALIDRTWAYRQELRNTIGGAVVVGRKYGAESAITALHAFYLKHEMIPANRGVCGLAFEPGEIEQDAEALEAARRIGERILELGRLLGR
ncbi:MAG: flavodoxin family protein [Armatimonadota bacterium]